MHGRFYRPKVLWEGGKTEFSDFFDFIEAFAIKKVWFAFSFIKWMTKKNHSAPLLLCMLGLGRFGEIVWLENTEPILLC